MLLDLKGGEKEKGEGKGEGRMRLRRTVMRVGAGLKEREGRVKVNMQEEKVSKV